MLNLETPDGYFWRVTKVRYRYDAQYGYKRWGYWLELREDAGWVFSFRHSYRLIAGSESPENVTSEEIIREAKKLLVEFKVNERALTAQQQAAALVGDIKPPKKKKLAIHAPLAVESLDQTNEPLGEAYGENQAYWRCTCGAINLRSNQYCADCSRSR